MEVVRGKLAVNLSCDLFQPPLRKILAEELKTVFEDECLTPVSIEVADELGDREFIDLDKGTFTKPQHE